MVARAKKKEQGSGPVYHYYGLFIVAGMGAWCCGMKTSPTNRQTNDRRSGAQVARKESARAPMTRKVQTALGFVLRSCAQISFNDRQNSHLMTDKFPFMPDKFHLMTEPT